MAAGFIVSVNYSMMYTVSAAHTENSVSQCSSLYMLYCRCWCLCILIYVVIYLCLMWFHTIGRLQSRDYNDARNSNGEQEAKSRMKRWRRYGEHIILCYSSDDLSLTSLRLHDVG